jgi:hypothetical protein
MSVEVYQRGDTIPIWLEVMDWQGNHVDPTHGVTLVHLTSPKSVKKAENQAMTKIETGKYVYYYASQSGDETGWWRYQIKTQDGSGFDAKYTISEGSFELR